jgi:hypothetical protein
MLIFGSVILVLGYLFGTPLLYGGQFIPPALSAALAFVSLGVALVAFAELRAMAPEDRIGVATLGASWFVLLVFGLLAAGVTTVGYVNFRTYERSYRAQVEHELGPCPN